MSKISDMKAFRTPDGTEWGVDVQLPSSSNAMIVFHHPDGRTARKDRYAWYNWRGPDANKVNQSLGVAQVRAALDEPTIRDLFRRSMLIGSGLPAFPLA